MIIKPSKSFEGSELPPAGNTAPSSATFTSYLDTLNWGAGNRDESGLRAFLRAASLRIDPDKAIEEVAARIKAGGGSVDHSKLRSQTRRAYAYAGNRPGSMKDKARTIPLQFCPDKLKELASKAPGIDADWLIAHSPVPPSELSSSRFLEHLYAPGEKVLTFTDFRSQGQCLYVVGSSANLALPDHSPEGVWFLVNPVDGNYHPNPRHENRPSRRSEESVTAWRYLVLESDVAAETEWLSCLVQLPLKIPAIYTSGGKSVHALVRLDAATKEDWDRQKREIAKLVVPLGADKNAMTGVRLSRLPGSKRGEQLQRLLYLAPAPADRPIVSR